MIARIQKITAVLLFTFLMWIPMALNTREANPIRWGGGYLGMYTLCVGAMAYVVAKSGNKRKNQKRK